MNKKHKILFSICAIFIGIFSLFTGLAPLFTYADSSTSYNVSFIAPDNSLLYSVSDIPSGSNLNDLYSANYLQNPSFIDYSFNGTSYTFSNWVKYSDSLVLTPSYNILCVNNSTNNPLNLQQRFTFEGLGVVNATFIVCDEFDNYAYRTYSVDTTNKTASSVSSVNNIDAIHYLDCFYGSSGPFQVNIYFKKESSVNIKYCSFILGSEFKPFFDINYLNEKLNSYNAGNYYYTYDIDYSSPITSNKYYYPKQNFYGSDTWYAKTWQGISNLDGRDIFVIGSSYVYYSNQTFGNYVLDLSTSTWNPMAWGGLTSFNGRNVWTDGYDYYYSYSGNQYVLDVQTLTWTTKTWTGLSAFSGQNVWSDGYTYYLSEGFNQYVLNTATSTWSEKIWTGSTNFSGRDVWTDGSNFYLSSGSNQYILDVQTSTWITKTWYNLNNYYGQNVWTDGTNYYYSYSSEQYVLNVLTSTWTTKTWYNLNDFNAENVWKFNDNIYYSGSIYQYVLNYSNTSDYYYENGYNQGYANGFVNGDYSGYNRGYSKGVEEAGNFTFFSLFGSIVDAPVNTLMSLFNFQLLGVNLWAFFTGLLTLAVFIFVIKLVLGGK